MKLPGAERAVVEIAKLRDYCLNEWHPRGRYKARVFKSALGLGEQHTELLRDALLKAAIDSEVRLGDRDDYGQRYVLDFRMKGAAGEAMVRSIWIVVSGEDYPRMTSCYVL